MGQPQTVAEDGFEGTFADELEPGHTLMHGQYTIESFLNAGGFGITYRARDSLGRTVVIKECFPGSFCRRSTTELVHARSRAHQQELTSIVKLFVQEAHSLARLTHPNIVGVHQVFEENNTAYMALDFIEGRDLLDMIEEPTEVLEPEQVEILLRKLLDAVGFIHGRGVLHRDISPDNILLKPGMEPILIDFGAAREEASKQSRVLSALRVVKDGYSPQEFYISGSEQGPFSDLYALGATFYHLITGELPANSQSRLAAVASGEDDPYLGLAERFPGYSDNFLRAIDQALAILPKNRISSAKAWLAILENGGAAQMPTSEVAAAVPAPKSGGSKGMLLGGSAVIALIVGAVVMTQLGGNADASTGTVFVATTDVPDAAAIGAAALISPDAAPVATTSLLLFRSHTPEFSADPITVSAPDIYSFETEPATLTPPAAQDEMFDAAIATALAAAPEAPKPPVLTMDIPEDRMVPEPYTPPVVETVEPDIETPDEQVVAESDASPVVASEPEPQAAADRPLPAWMIKPQHVETPLESATAVAKIVPEIYNLPQVITTWSVDLPGSFDTGTDRIFAVNSVSTTNQADVDALLRASVATPSGDTLEVTVLQGETLAEAETQTITVPVVQRTLFLNGLLFETRFEDANWITQVLAAPAALGLDIAPGDILAGDLSGGLSADSRTALPDLLKQANAENRQTLALAFKRDGQMKIVDVPNPGTRRN